MAQGTPREIVETLEAQARAQEAEGNRVDLLSTLSTLATLLRELSDEGRARAALDQAYRLAQDIGDQQGMAPTLHQLAVLYHLQGGWDRALELHHRALALQKEVQNRSGIALTLGSIAEVFNGKGEFGKALEELDRKGSQGDTSAAERYLEAILELQPNHLEAQWQLLIVRLAPSRNISLSDRAEALSAFSSGFARLAKQAKETKQEAFLHYMTAKHAGLYNDFERALSEIERAVTLEPRSARYLTAKGDLLVESGQWKDSDAEVEKGISVLKEARVLSRAIPGPFVRDASYEFSLASAITGLSRPRWEEVIGHYQRYLETGPRESVTYAFALNNISLAYRRVGDCARAKEAAERALAVMKFGAAEWNKRYAEFCLEMQKSGLIARH